jgi:hypothetical protein
MWRAFFLAIGLFTFILGFECLLIDRATFSDIESGAARDLIPPDWAPWSLMSAGAVVMLYSFTLPAKFKG